jgi:hypothetical protein
VDVTWKILLTVMLFTMAHFLKALAAKLVSSTFYRTAHMQKVQAALEKVGLHDPAAFKGFFSRVLRPHKSFTGACRFAGLHTAQQ